MKLVHVNMERKLLDDNVVTEWVIEAPEEFTRYVQELYMQCEGAAGDFVLSDGEKELGIAKNVEFLDSVLDLDVNERKILGKLYADLEQLAYSEKFVVRTQEMIQYLRTYIFELEQETDFMLDVDDGVDMSAIFKGNGVKLETVETGILEKIVHYIKVVRLLLKKQVFVFVNVRSYLTVRQVEQLIKEAAYQEVQILLIENVMRDCVNSERRCIIDSDKCEI
ncbi:type II-A CRISPR-associated protein Csn2 [Roseburia hominis]|uniref:Type II-A CRISPR-associated protein Csn2 n=1 Tax=Roseburia hominis TaxID=301301 RepID=A0A395V7X7_9FIRM|nr:type II-A CRISPR-associated protein Csn2 [Roseburia hominis]